MQPPALEDVQRAVGERYEVLSVAGTGGMGAVFRARHRALGHIVAVKVLPPEVAASAMRRERFRREAKLGASLDHPNIVRVYDFDTTGGITLLIMTFVRGVTLEMRLRDAPPPSTIEIVRWVRDIAAALSYAHRRGIVHRDVKPSNILLDEDSGRALLTDFGIARVEGVAEPSLTDPGAPIGTPGYMAPEQVASGRVDARADLYALAVVAFEALMGEAPVPGANRAALARKLRSARRELVTREADALAAPLAQLPDDRPRSAETWLASFAPPRPKWSRWALAAGATVLASIGLIRFAGGPATSRDAASRLAVMPFTVLGTAPYPAQQLSEYFISRFRPVEQLTEVVSPGRIAAQVGTAPPSNGEARDVALRFSARFYIQGSVFFAESTFTLTATLYQDGRARRTGVASGRVGRDESRVMDQVWTQLYPEFTPSPEVTLPNGGPDVLAAYLNAEAAFRRGDYRGARDGYTKVIAADSDFAMARLRLALVTAQVDPTEEGLGAALRAAERHQRGLSSADSLLFEGFSLLVSRGDGVTALERFKRATQAAPRYPQAWYVLGEFYYHFGGLFDQSLGEAAVAFNRVLDLDPRFSPAIGHLISLANQAGDRAETARLIHDYLQIDSTSVVAEVIGIADTLLLRTAPARVALLKTACRHSFRALQYLAFQAAVFGTGAQRQGPARAILRCLEQRGASDGERRLALRMGVAADLSAGWADSARARLNAAGATWAERERDEWVLATRATGLSPLGDWMEAARRLSARAEVPDTDATRHWLLARVGVDRARHAAALARLARHGAPLSASLSADLRAREALGRSDSALALRTWDQATRRYAVLSVPLELVASLWPLRLDMARVAVTRHDTAVAARACGSFDVLLGYVDQIAERDVSRVCAGSRR
jgi:serine/threonine protein kinase/Tfp pilus assembly protein PilF